MNDSDIQLITSLIEGQLSGTEHDAAFARVESDAELRAAYDEQLAVALALRAVPRAAMSAEEREHLNAALRAELRLDDAAPAPAAAAASGSRWSRWWLPLTGFATAAIVIVALVVIPNIDGDQGLDDTGVALQTTAPTQASEPFTGATEDSAVTGGEEAPAAPTTTAAAAEEILTNGMLFLAESPDTAEEVPVLGDGVDAAEEVEAATRSATQFAPIDYEALVRCFGSEVEDAARAVVVGSITVSGDELVLVVTDPTTGKETVVTINLATCEVTSAG